MQPELTIQIVGWNSADALRVSLPTLAAIPAAEVNIRYIDNGSHDDSVALIRKHIPRAEIIELPENIGFTGGHNVGLAVCTTPFVLILNPDVVLDWHAVLHLLSSIKENSRLAAIQGLLLRPGSAGAIDSAGIVRTITLNGIDRGAGKLKGVGFAKPAFVDATTGACSLFRMKALEHISHGHYQIGQHTATEIFDKDFFAYKEDVDLGWRLQTAGWKVMFEPIEVGIHGRELKPSGRFGWKIRPSALMARLQNQRTRMSLRNYVWLVVKNASPMQFLLHEIFIDLRLLVFFVLSLVYWPLFRIWPETLRGIPSMLHKRGYEAIDHRR